MSELMRHRGKMYNIYDSLPEFLTFSPLFSSQFRGFHKCAGVVGHFYRKGTFHLNSSYMIVLHLLSSPQKMRNDGSSANKGH